MIRYCLFVVFFLTGAIAVSSQVCHTYNLTDSNYRAYIQSPDYPAYYPPDTIDCWDIYSGSASKPRLYLLEEYFRLESDGNKCRYDWVKLRDGTTEVDTYCGKKAFGDHVSYSSHVRISFKSDYRREYRGFSFRIDITSRQPDELTPGEIAAIVVCSVMFVVFVVAGIVLFVLMQKKKKRAAREAAASGGSDERTSMAVSYNTQQPGPGAPVVMPQPYPPPPAPITYPPPYTTAPDQTPYETTN